MDKLGKMIRITDLRSIWPHEANDFTKWLAQEENLAKKREAWSKAYNWFLEKAIVYKEIAAKYGK